jgi:copper oxidase (laccase) domain-containing protein
MQLIGALILIGILVLLLGAALYFARSQKTKNDSYGSWSQVLGPQFRGSAFDVGEKLNKEIEKGQQQARRTRHANRSRNK